MSTHAHNVPWTCRARVPPTRPLASVWAAMRRATAAPRASATRGASSSVICRIAVISKWSTFSPAIRYPQNGRPGHKQACKTARKERVASAESTISVEKDPGTNTKHTSAPSAINAAVAADLCVHCTAAPGLLVCQGCHQAGYCSLSCQQGAWWVGLTWRSMIDLASRLHIVS